MSVVKDWLTARTQGLFDANPFPQEQYTDPPGDPGLFGPESATWCLQGDWSLLIGGISGLMIQSLHPLVMAGVMDHSDFRDRPLARFSRTSAFVRATTYGSRPVVESVVATVRAVHERIAGVAPDGRPYRANDPELLRWVHVTEHAYFVASHRKYHPDPLSDADIDRYYAEVATVADMLGATDVPRTQDEVDAYFSSVRSQLAAGEAALRTVDFIKKGDWQDTTVRGTFLLPAKTGYSIVVRAAVDLLPEWAREMLSLKQSPVALIAPLVVRILRSTTGPPPARIEAEARCSA